MDPREMKQEKMSSYITRKLEIFWISAKYQGRGCREDEMDTWHA
jgi:hypothetical protein